MFLIRVSGRVFGSEGAVALSEPLGRLAALQYLDLGGTILILVLTCGGPWVCVRLEGAFHACCWTLFHMRVSDSDFGPEGAVALSEPLGRLAALQYLDLGGTILILV